MFLTRRCYQSSFLPPPPLLFFFLIAVSQPAEHINLQIQAGISHSSKRSGFGRQIVGITRQQSLTVTSESSLLSDSAASSLSHMHKAAIVSSSRGARTT